MSEGVGNRLEGDLWRFLHQGEAYKDGGKAVPIITIDEEGFPHVALVNCVVAADPTTVRIPLSLKSGSYRNLERSGRATLAVVEPGHLYHLKCSLQPGATPLRCYGALASVSLHVEKIIADSERLYRMESGMSYSYGDRAEQIKQLEQEIIAELSEG